MRALIALILIVYLVGWIGFYMLQDKIIFQHKKLDKEYTFRFDQPFEEHFIQTEDGEMLMDQRYDGLQPPGLLLVDPGSWTLTRDQSTISLDSVVVVSPHNAVLSINSRVMTTAGAPLPAPVVEEYPPLAGDWSGMVAARVSLQDARELLVSQAGVNCSFPVSAPPARPRIDSVVIPNVRSANGDPVFGQIPSLVLPQNIPAAMFRASVRIDDSPASGPDTGEGLNEWLFRVIPRSCPARVELTVRGPLGSDLRTRFVVVPGLTLKIPARPLFPSDSARAVFGTTDPELRVVSPLVRAPRQDLGATTRSTLAMGGQTVPGAMPFIIDPPGDAVHVEFSVVEGAARVGATRADLVVELPVVRWSLAVRGVVPRLATAGGDVALSDLSDMWLTLHLGRPEPFVRIVLCERGEIVQELQGVKTTPEGRMSTSMAAFTDTARQRAGNSLSIQLRVGERQLDLGRIRHGANSVEHAVRIEGTRPSVLKVNVESSRAVPSMVLELCELARPWARVLRFELSGGECETEIDLTPGKWRERVLADDGWSEEAITESRVLSVGTDLEHAFERLRLLSSTEPEEIVERVLRGGLIGGQLDPHTLSAVVPFAIAALVDVVGHIRDLLPQVFETCALLASLNLAATVDELNRIVPRARLDPMANVRLSLELCRKIVQRHGKTAVTESSLNELSEILPAVAAAAAVATRIDGDTLDRLLGAEPGSDYLGAPPDYRRTMQTVVQMSSEALSSLRNALILVPGPACAKDELLAATMSLLEIASRFPTESVPEAIDPGVPEPLSASIKTYLPSSTQRAIGPGVFGPFTCYRACALVLSAPNPGDALTVLEAFLQASPRSVEAYLCRAIRGHHHDQQPNLQTEYQ